MAQSWCGHPPRHPPGSARWCWPLAGRRALGPAGPPLLGSPCPPRGAMPAPVGSGWPGHSLPWLLLGLLLLRRDGSGSRVVSSGAPSKGSGQGGGEVVHAGCVRAAGRGWSGAGRPCSGGSGAGGIGVLEGGPQHPDWLLCIQPVDAHGCLQQPAAKGRHHTLMESGLQGLEELWLVLQTV